MKKKIHKLLFLVMLGGCLNLIIVSNSNAIPVVFDFTNLASSNGVIAAEGVEYNMTQDSVDLAISASGGGLHENVSNGLGVAGSPTANRVGYDAGTSIGESIKFNFTPLDVMLLESVIFERNQDGGTAAYIDVFADGTFMQNVVVSAGIPSDPYVAVDFSTYNIHGEMFTFAAAAPPNGMTGAGFRVRELTVGTNPVPEPATVALLGIGLVGLAGVGARRKWKKKAVDKS